jgi:hypothetical protein
MSQEERETVQQVKKALWRLVATHGVAIVTRAFVGLLLGLRSGMSATGRIVGSLRLSDREFSLLCELHDTLKVERKLEPPRPKPQPPIKFPEFKVGMGSKP